MLDEGFLRRVVGGSLCAALATVGACTKAPATQPVLAGQDVHLTVIHTADLHSRLFPYQFAPGQIDKGLGLLPSHGDLAIVGGAARIATVVARERAHAERVIHVDSGDIFEGAPVFNLFTGAVEMQAWTKLGVTAMALGNHEFDKGPVNLEVMKMQYGGFPILAANYLFADPSDTTEAQPIHLSQLISPFTIVNAQGLRIGIIGMGNLESLDTIVQGGNSLGIRPVEPGQALRDAIHVLRPKDNPNAFVDLLIVLSHLGLDEDEAAAQTNQSATGNSPCKTDGDCAIGTCMGGLCEQSCMTDGDCTTGSCTGATPTQAGICEGGVVDQNQVAAVDGVDVIFGGHLHIVLNPPKDLPRYDAAGNPEGHTILCHSGAFAKYVGRLDLVVHVATHPCAPGEDPVATACKDPQTITADDQRSAVKSYTYKLIPIDDTIREDADMARILEPYQLQMNTQLNLTQNYAIIPCDNSQSTCPKVSRSDPDGGDAQLGNLVAASMRLRKRVEADFGLTNSLGIRADFESGPLNLEEMYNVFPFDNTITTVYLSGHEIGQMLDFIALRSGQRGCKTQAQVSGIWFMMDCSRSVACGPYDAATLSLIGHGKTTNDDGSPWRPTPAAHCTPLNSSFGDGGWLSSNLVDGPPLIGDDCINHPEFCRAVKENSEYLAAVNDYIAAGGSGFTVLKNNTTKFNTGISLRDALLDYIRDIPNNYPDLQKDCAPLANQNICSAQQDLTEPRRTCTACAPQPIPGVCNPMIDPACQAMVDQQCGPGHVCAQDPSLTGDSNTYCLRFDNYGTLPCLSFRLEAHDGRIGHSQ